MYGPRTQAYGETKYKNSYYYKFWTEPRPCIVLGLKPMGKPSTKTLIFTSSGQNQGLVWSSDSSLWGNQAQKFLLLQVLDGTKALYVPRTQAYGETNCSDRKSSRLKYCKVLRPMRVLGRWWNAPVFNGQKGLFIWWAIYLQMVIFHTASSLQFSPRPAWVIITFHWSALLRQAFLLEF